MFSLTPLLLLSACQQVFEDVLIPVVELTRVTTVEGAHEVDELDEIYIMQFAFLNLAKVE